MQTQRHGVCCAAVGPSEAGGAIDSDRTLAQELAQEFGAPVGVLDLETRSWRAIIGTPERSFPAVDDRLLGVCRSSRPRPGQPLVWRPREDAGTIWLVMPLPWVGAVELVALIGFRAGDGS